MLRKAGHTRRAVSTRFSVGEGNERADAGWDHWMTKQDCRPSNLDNCLRRASTDEAQTC
ncbi:unnamed protein product [Ascophyllum nodosum]